MKETAVENIEYAFLVGKIRCLEARLIHPSLFYQLVDTASFNDIRALLSSTSYKDLGESLLSMESLLEENLLREANELQELSPLPSPVAPFLQRWDIAHLKKAFRSIALDSPVEFNRKAYLAPRLYEKACHTKDPLLLPPPFSLWLRKALQIKEEDSFLAGELSIETSFLLESLNTPFPLIREYFRQEIDFYNLKLALRKLKNSPLPLDFLIPGGAIYLNHFHLLARGEVDAFIRYLTTTSYTLLAQDALPYWKEKGESWRIELNFWKLRLKILSPANYSPFIPEAVFYYLLKKENEIRNLRWIIQSKSAGWEAEKIKERLGPFHA
ncbi:MAG: V-type ATPase subunit [Caldiserica bacterium]|nr:V-type ATPase subunit [Caldisericota bacterium]